MTTVGPAVFARVSLCDVLVWSADTQGMESLRLAGLLLAIGATLAVSLCGSAAGALGVVWPGVVQAEGLLAFVPLIAVVLACLLVVGSPAFPGDPEHPRLRPVSDRFFNLIALLTLVGVTTSVVGVVAAGKYAPTSLPHCRWALTWDHGFEKCSSHLRWLRATVGNSQVGIGIGTGISAVLCGLATAALKRSPGRP